MNKINDISTLQDALRLIQHRIPEVTKVIVLTDSLDTECNFIYALAYYKECSDDRKEVLVRLLNMLLPTCIFSIAEEDFIRDRHMMIWRKNSNNYKGDDKIEKISTSNINSFVDNSITC